MNEKRILYLFTRTPLHVGAGASVGAIDQPIIRERHTGFPVIPASSLKGTFADGWNTELKPDKDGNRVRVVAEKQGDKWIVTDMAENAAWLFGSDNANVSWNGALQFSEARLLAFPIRSAKGSFAWITCPLMLRRAERDQVFTGEAEVLRQACKAIKDLKEPADDEALLPTGKLDLDVQKNGKPVKQVVLEEYIYTRADGDQAAHVGKALATLLTDPVWQEVASRLVILSDGMMSFFAQNACEVAQHVRIDDETGTAAGGALFNQENVPSEAMFYSVLHAFRGRGEKYKDKTPEQAIKAFQGQDEGGSNQKESPGVRDGSVFQFGGDASTGLGYCTVRLSGEKGA